MIGIILAAGIGSRLRPMTNSKPKCLITTAGKPMLQYQIDAYRKAGITEIVIVVGYEGGAIIEYCKHIKDLDIKIIENEEYEHTNNMYSLYLTKGHVQGQEFILNNADLSIDESIISRLVDCPAKDAIAVDTSVFNEEAMKISIDDRGVIGDISKMISEADAFACSIDIYKFSKGASEMFFEKMREIIEVEKNLKDWTEVAMQRSITAGELVFEPCDIKGLSWVEIDNYEDLALSDRVFSYFDDKLNGIDNVLFDLDGTIYVGTRAIDGVPATIRSLKKSGKNVYFLSNNSSKSKSDYVDRLAGFGIETDISKIVLSTDGLISFLKRELVHEIHVLGTNALKKILLDEGFRIDTDRPEYVVLGYDTELTYAKLVTACKYINEGVDILATHADRFCPSEIGPIPDIGALTEMIAQTTGARPMEVFGKPRSEMVEPLISKFALDPNKTLIVGDRLHTDILMSKKTGCYGMLVLSGETSRDQVEDSSVQPDFILGSVGAM